ncbi:MAG: tRNA threonylcarbamoyladenosine dehydratase [Lachnospiraceae bacterium]|nr:tRNA threonylcarbamoyladenosine dehydratase [Lachnospiraceae bacterium]
MNGEQRFIRTGLLLGKTAMERLAACHVAVFGLGGVGGYVCEALARSGIGAMDIIDADRVDISNINRQIIATQDTIGMLKTEVMESRLKSIDPDLKIKRYDIFFLPENADEIPFSEYDYVIDAVDTVSAKLAIIEKCKKAGVPVISSMGTGNKLDPGRLKITDISKTDIDPLARVMRRELKKRGITGLKVVYSDEKPLPHHPSVSLEPEEREGARPRIVPGSCAFVPPVAGLMMAAEVIRDIVKDC